MKPIEYIDRTIGEKRTEKTPGGGMLKWFYYKPIGKLALHILIKRKVLSALGGWYMNSKLSKKRIPSFVQNYGIDLSEYQIENPEEFKSFNDFFYRKIMSEKRPIGEGVVSPADSKVLAFQQIEESHKFFIKGSGFSLSNFLQNLKLAGKYENGSMLIFRLAPADYHRFHFPADGVISESEKIKGYYYSVSPIALKQSLKIFLQNKREYCVLKTEKFGEIIYAEVGATLVGSIVQTYAPNSEVLKGEEKGYFAFGGSTIVLLFEKGRIKINPDLVENTKSGFETYIKIGESIAS